MTINHATLLTLVQTFCCMAATLGLCGHQEATAQDLGAYSVITETDERYVGPRWVSRSSEENGNSVSTRAGAPVERYAEDDSERQSLWDAYDGSTLFPKRDTYDFTKEGNTQEAGKVDCDCGADCKCPPLVCKAGHCKANYVAMFSATWCRPCQKMYPLLKEMRKEGYIVYIYTLDTDDFKDLNLDSKFQIQAYPTFVFFNEGKETHRMVGFSQKDKFYPHLKKEKDQDIKKPEPIPDPDIYDDL